MVVREGRTSSSKSLFTFRVGGRWTSHNTPTVSDVRPLQGRSSKGRTRSSGPRAMCLVRPTPRSASRAKRVALYDERLLAQANDGACGPGDGRMARAGTCRIGGASGSFQSPPARRSTTR